jgi:hypothetical protein
MTITLNDQLKQLERLDFGGKGEEFVESRFITPLLECLGYETHTDYEVIRHGDDGAAFELRYPPVESGAVKVRHYQPDYIPTIRKKMFWIIEAKSPKDVAHPFEGRYVVQGLQYCVHPEIQAKYLLLSNGTCSSVYDAHGAVFFEKDMYTPILGFKAFELSQRWPEIYQLLSVEKLRTRIETDLKAMYDKMCLSSLDKNYPSQLLAKIGASSRDNSKQIEKHVNSLVVKGMNQAKAAWRNEMEQLDASEVFARMDFPMPPGGSEAQYFLNKSLANGKPPEDILGLLIRDFDRQSIFRKEQTFIGVCVLYKRIGDSAVRAKARGFLDQYKDADLPLLNQVECAHLRITRKVAVLSVYPQIRERINRELQSAPELVRLVRPPTAFDMSYPAEVELHRRTFEQLKLLSDADLHKLLESLLKMEGTIEQDYKSARAKLTGWEVQLVGSAFEHYGVGGRHYAFKNIMVNLGVEPRT